MPSVDYPHEFYLGRRVDPETSDVTKEAYTYDPDDLTTHAVAVGMTGSGKTGLCLDLMEEAALKGLPAILIDPKGDITNLLLHFPDMLPEDFKPWINADDARRDGLSIDQAAIDTATLWKNGLADWGIESDRIRRLKDSVDRAVYTPGSTAGKPISILASLKAPQLDWQSNQEVLLEQIEGTVTALLSLIGMDDIDPISDPEHILLSRIIADAWAAGTDIGMGELIMQSQNPPFDKLGFFSVDQFFPKKKRMALAMKLNSIVAAPSFQPWISGEPLDIQSLLYGTDGKPKHSIFYIAHLGEAERMFIVTLLYSAIETWMRSQSGTTSLRALVYFDEIFGYLPPTANPPSKKPMLRMLKQARAFGVGMVVATQNPVDIDYKGLSNAGTWFIGRLQTERDKERLLDGLQGASDGQFDRSASDKMLSGLGKRVFLVNNVHQRSGPELLQTRWAMNYMAGPMTRNQIPGLNALVGAEGKETQKTSVETTPEAQPATRPETQPETPVDVSQSQKSRKLKGSRASVTAMSQEATSQEATSHQEKATQLPRALQKYTHTRPQIASSLEEYFLPRQTSYYRALQRGNSPVSTNQAERLGLVYLPRVLLQAHVLYTDRKGSYSKRLRYAALISDPVKHPNPRFEKFTIAPFDPDNLETEPEDDVLYGEIDPIMQSVRKIKPLSTKYKNYIYREAVMPLYRNTPLKLTSQPDESEQEFLDRCHQAGDDREDAEIVKVQARFDKQLERLKTKLRREQRDLDEDEDTLNALKMETMVNYGKAIANIAGGFFGGRRRRSGLSTALTKRRQQKNARADVRESIEEIAVLREQLDELTRKHELQMIDIDKQWSETAAGIEIIKVSPLKKNIAIEVFGVAWQPHWIVRVKSRTRLIAAG